MAQLDTLIKDGKVVIPVTGIVEADIGIKDGKIAGVFSRGLGSPAAEEIDAKGKYILPGAIDPHTHPGYPKGGDTYKGYMTTETPGMAIGGITTIIGFYRQYGRKPAQITEDEFNGLVRDWEAASLVDFAMHFMIPTKDVEWFDKYVNDYGVPSLKYTKGYAGAEAAKLGITVETDDGFFFDSFLELNKFPNVVVAFHCENVDIAYRIAERLKATGRQDLAAWSEARPDFCEAESVRRMLYIADVTGVALYVVHTTCKKALDEAREWRLRRPETKFWIETCNSYLSLTGDSPCGKLAKVNPPIRTQADQDALWEGLRDGMISTVGSDHCAIKREQKEDLWTGVPGFPGAGMILPVLLDGVNKGKLSLEKVAEVSAYNTAKIFSLYPRKGTIQAGSDADLAIVDLDLEQTVTLETIPSATGFSLWEDTKMKGWPVMTILRGEIVAKDGKVVGKGGIGRYIPRK